MTTRKRKEVVTEEKIASKTLVRGPYESLLAKIMTEGEVTSNRTGVNTRSLFGEMMKFDLRQGFPAVTTKKLAWRQVVGELLWFLEGSTDERRLAELTYGKKRSELNDKRTIWSDNYEAYSGTSVLRRMSAELGPVYGAQWRRWYDSSTEMYVDQVQEVLHKLVNEPESRRIIITAWNPPRLSLMALPPCHVLSQYRVIGDELHAMMFQRSADMVLGVPFNVASYALLTHIFAQTVGLRVGTYTHVIGDAHIYSTHDDVVTEQLTRESFPLPRLEIDDEFDLRDRLRNGFRLDDVNRFKLVGYESHDALSAPMVV